MVIDLTNKRFGYVIAKNPTDERKRQSVVWECLCDCGNTCYFSAKELRETKYPSCGCEPVAWIKNLRGQIFGQIEVLEITKERRMHSYDANPSVIWKCMCHACGNECFLSARTLTINNAKSCGCAHVLPDGESCFRNVLNSYKKDARRAGRCWELTNEQAKKLFESNCHYCGIEPQNTAKFKHLKGSFTYNGIDRVDNNKGYEVSNVVPCCQKCNEVKLAMTLEDFEYYIEKVYNNYFINKGWQNFSWEYKTKMSYNSYCKVLLAYKRHAGDKGVKWNLTDQQTESLIANNCHYCGVEPNNGIGRSKYSGIDALDPKKDYDIENTVSCCFKCNKAKRAMTLKEFTDYIFRLYNYYFIEMKRAGKFRPNSST